MRRFAEAESAAEKPKKFRESKKALFNRKEIESLVSKGKAPKAITVTVPQERQQKYKKSSYGPALITEEYVPQMVTRAKNITIKTLNPCKPSARAGTSRECQVELTFLSERAAEFVSKRNGGMRVDPGPYMRVCLRPEQPGRLIPIRDPIEAKNFAEQYCRCTKRSDTTSEACLRAGQEMSRAALGRATPRRRRR